jgi:hypothetical protein
VAPNKLLGAHRRFIRRINATSIEYSSFIALRGIDLRRNDQRDR